MVIRIGMALGRLHVARGEVEFGRLGHARLREGAQAIGLGRVEHDAIAVRYLDLVGIDRIWRQSGQGQWKHVAHPA